MLRHCLIRGKTLPAGAAKAAETGLFGRGAVPNNGNATRVTDGKRLEDITQKLRCWGYLSHFPDAERDVAWLLEQLGDRDARIAELEARLRETEWLLSLP